MASSQGGTDAGRLGLELAAGLAVAIALGVGAALLVRWAFLRDQVPEVLKTPVLLALVLTVYALSNQAMTEAGLMAATVFGVALALPIILLCQATRSFTN